MKAFTFFPKEEVDLRLLLSKIQNYGTCNCSFETFSRIYNEWHLKTFPGNPISARTVNFREDWFRNFVSYLAQRDIEPTNLPNTDDRQRKQ